MRQPAWKQTLRTRPVRKWLLAITALAAALAWRLLSPFHVSVLPFTYSAVQGSVRIRTQVEGQTRPLEFDTLAAQTTLGRRLYEQLVQEQRGIDRISPSADFGLGGCHSQLFYEEIGDAELHPHTDGILGIDLFTPSRGFDGQNVRLGARLTLDFKENLLKLEDGPALEPLHLPPGTVQAPLLRDGAGPFYLLLPLNDGASYRFLLGIGTRDVILPTGAVLFPAPQGTGYVDARGMVPVTLTMSGQDLTVQAMALPRFTPTGILGMNLLANYRVILDFRNRRLYLEPTNSPSDF